MTDVDCLNGFEAEYACGGDDGGVCLVIVPNVDQQLVLARVSGIAVVAHEARRDSKSCLKRSCSYCYYSCSGQAAPEKT